MKSADSETMTVMKDWMIHKTRSQKSGPTAGEKSGPTAGNKSNHSGKERTHSGYQRAVPTAGEKRAQPTAGKNSYLIVRDGVGQNVTYF